MIKINGVLLNTYVFPNKEIGYQTQGIWQHSEGNVIEFKYEDDTDILKLIMAKKYIDDRFTTNPTILKMNYIPYSRMDRKIEGNFFTLKYFCQLINDLRFDTVYVLDPHSNVSTALLNRCCEYSVNKFIDRVFHRVGNDIDYVFYPDNGACKRYSEILKLPNNIPYFFGNKKRNLQTGEIIEYELVNCPGIKDKNILIIDDLCAKGFTFYNAAQKLKEAGAKDIYLYITHCEDSIYDGEIFKTDLIKRVFTTNSILSNYSDERLVVFPI